MRVIESWIESSLHEGFAVELSIISLIISGREDFWPVSSTFGDQSRDFFHAPPVLFSVIPEPVSTANGTSSDKPILMELSPWLQVWSCNILIAGHGPLTDHQGNLVGDFLYVDQVEIPCSLHLSDSVSKVVNVSIQVDLTVSIFWKQFVPLLIPQVSEP